MLKSNTTTEALLIAQGEDGGYRRNMAARTPDS